ncbi:hypothetical protein [Vibrio sp. SCSIO 43137]|uniref:hypothetical protein n=1 Tax=Vibrio sp. SCSIO 43137 TaxID=3021011 RepID=UPI002306E69D|nr:hypothetical protein [Vibrio sp. SCSIO 43137]WCE28776.1 hypothetical protein PK654_10420 [Vibrio sp. SCSIO 43137]
MYFSNKSAFLLTFSVMVLFGCESEGVFTAGENIKQPASSAAKLFYIDVTPRTTLTSFPVQYTAIGKYDDGTEADISGLVNWNMVTPNVASFTPEGLARPKGVGVTKITANLDGITSDEVSLTVRQSMVCGHQLGNFLDTGPNGGINDTDLNNAAGNCLKIREVVDPDDNKTKWFTSTPSDVVMAELGYIEQHNATNSGDSYAFDWQNTNPTGRFALFRQDGENVTLPGDGNDADAGVGGQYDRWCKKLSALNFAGQSNWRRATIEELFALNVTRNGVDFGWPNDPGYFSATLFGEAPLQDHYRILYIELDLPDDFAVCNSPAANAASAHYASCVSKLE